MEANHRAYSSGVTSKKPVLVVVGTTGVGKSNLAMEIAARVGIKGEVINADSMQVYKGMDVITNKVTPEERSRVPHHLLDFVDPMSEYSVLQFERDALAVIDEIHSRGKVPILVGGTHYYIQSILWDSNLVSSKREEQQQPEDEKCNDDDTRAHPSIDPDLALAISNALKQSDATFKLKDEQTQAETATEIVRLLSLVDPVMALRWHPNDWRKNRRSLQVFYTTGERHSDILDKQKEDGGGSLRFRTGVFWLWAENKMLDARLDGRVHDMIKNGLFSEITEMRRKVVAGQVAGTDMQTDSSNPIDYTRGVMQTIGFKEFDAYLTKLDEHAPSPTTQELEKLKAQAVESMQAATRRYARKQVTWIKNKLGPKCLMEARKADMSGSIAFWALDASDLTAWSKNVGDEGVRLANEFIAGTHASKPSDFTLQLLQVEDAELLPPTGTPSLKADWTSRVCEVCLDKGGKPKLVHGAREWAIHVKSNSHTKMVKRQKRRQEFKQWDEKKRASGEGDLGK
ncbi:tRNA dimethylallyltransferase [Chytriomyces confervae]|uniref:tRNA dimethylallyltransferase n=1 Tax=Chytriomyces confervae TaxID=246404 RepID=A0A507FBQ8_9FUNG|nr:tRNA dimethylallyltransferase [Chytriomyces confervae]